jgi:hypothetical protein
MEFAVVLTPLTVTPAPKLLIVAPERFAPASVTFTDVPTVPLLGLMEVNVGIAALTVKVTALLVPAAVVTVTG